MMSLGHNELMIDAKHNPTPTPILMCNFLILIHLHHCRIAVDCQRNKLAGCLCNVCGELAPRLAAIDNIMVSSGMSPWWPLLGLLHWCPIFMSSHINSFQGRAPVDFIYVRSLQMYDRLDYMIGTLNNGC